ncbi:MAG: ABC transporter ATP-binding protein [Thermoleophilia bacterium]|nr:ABC transporter ATP-binding protein [Thermoleophilia bacterium]
MLVVRDLRKQYVDGTDALAGISFELRRGEVLAVLGPNGAGKTSMVEIVTGSRSRTSGSVELLGADPADRSAMQRLRARVAVVAQSAAHLRYLTVRETLEMHRAYYATPRSVGELLALVGLDDSADQRVRQLSGGQQRRLDVAVALVGRPEVVFLDEPTTGFDPAARRRAWQVIASLARMGTSIVLTTHYMEEASTLADRVLVLRAGAIVGEGTPEELAGSLALETRISARLPLALVASELPPLVRAGISDDEGREGCFEVRTMEPTATLAALTSWAIAHGHELVELRVEPPTLEASYLALTGDAAMPVVVTPMEVDA